MTRIRPRTHLPDPGRIERGGQTERTDIPSTQHEPPADTGSLSMARDEDLHKLLATSSAGLPPVTAERIPGRSPLATRLRSGDSQLFRAQQLVAKALRTGTHTRKGQGPEASERVLSPAQRARIETILEQASPETARILMADLANIDGPAADLGRALYLKAAAARSPALLGADLEVRQAALATLAAFASRVDGMARAPLLACTSVLDLDSRRSTSVFDPLAWDEKRGVVHRRGDGDIRADNDGLFQRFMGSCGTTTLQMALCEEDPVRALVVNDAGLHAAGVDDVVGRFQAEVLREYGSAALGRRANFNLARLRNALARLRQRGELTTGSSRALRDHVERGAPLGARAQSALQALRTWLAGFPTDAELAEIRADPLKGSEGLEIDAFDAMLARYLGPVTGCVYDTVSLSDGLASALGEQALDRAEAVLRRGLDVPFGIDEPGHYMFMSAVRRRAGEREFLISDPWGGTSNWICERDLISGRFIETPLDLASSGGGGGVDCLSLARNPA
ncbi:MAG: hypothetical protein ABIJ09_25700 [Pseudomonadota bacterium]